MVTYTYVHMYTCIGIQSPLMVFTNLAEVTKLITIIGGKGTKVLCHLFVMLHLGLDCISGARTTSFTHFSDVLLRLEAPSRNNSSLSKKSTLHFCVLCWVPGSEKL